MDLPTFLVEVWRTAASVLSAWAWPTAVFGSMLLFRRELTALFGRIKSLRAIGAEATFGDGLDTLETAAPPPSLSDPQRPDISACETSTPGQSEVRVPDAGNERAKTAEPVVPSEAAETSLKKRDSLAKPLFWSIAHTLNLLSADQRNEIWVNEGSNALIRGSWNQVRTAVIRLFEEAISSGLVSSSWQKMSGSWSLVWSQLAKAGLISDGQLFRLDELRRLNEVARHASESLPLEQAIRYHEQATALAAELTRSARQLRATTGPKPAQE